MLLSDGRAEQQVPCLSQEARQEFGLFVELQSLYGSALVSHPGWGAENPVSLTLFLMSLGGFGSCCPNDDGRDQTWLCLTCEPK